ncbi:unnamed protein product [Prorocentrum cordatum]|uniref:Uncharacterized protein n=1 Tax=Prorocentrum cordatum TaxID=2364126 RepID=A0ABN9XBI4_9DINO|nr:unnamed protein product [Polarella glacialis]
MARAHLACPSPPSFPPLPSAAPLPPPSSPSPEAPARGALLGPPQLHQRCRVHRGSVPLPGGPNWQRADVLEVPSPRAQLHAEGGAGAGESESGPAAKHAQRRLAGARLRLPGGLRCRGHLRPEHLSEGSARPRGCLPRGDVRAAPEGGRQVRAPRAVRGHDERGGPYVPGPHEGARAREGRVRERRVRPAGGVPAGDRLQGPRPPAFLADKVAAFDVAAAGGAGDAVWAGGERPRLERDVKQQKLDTELLECAFDGDLDGLKKALEQGADAYALDGRMASALSEAAVQGHTEVMRHLLDNFRLSDPNGAQHDGRTPLHRAAFNGHMEAIALLLESGSDPRRKDRAGQRPFDLATGEEAQKALEAWDVAQTDKILVEWRKLKEVEEEKLVKSDEDNPSTGCGSVWWW